jgi:hypothetical protein
MNFPTTPLPPLSISSPAAVGEDSSSSCGPPLSSPLPNVVDLLSFQPVPMAVVAGYNAQQLQLPKKAASKATRKRKSNVSAALEAATVAVVTAAPTASTASSTVVRHKSIREAVVHLLTFKNDGFADVEFAERALLNLARKVSSDKPTNGMADWETCVREKSVRTPCVAVVRPKDGRMTVAKSSVAGTKKVFPQIIICQTFRWPNIVFHNDIRSSTEHCAFSSAVKPQDGQEGGDQICINPYHYVLTVEAMNRFNKHHGDKAKKGSAVTAPVLVPAALPAKPAASSPAQKKPATAKKANSRAKAAPAAAVEKAATPTGSELIDFDDKGVDYIKLWDETAVGGCDDDDDDDSNEIESFDEETLLNEIRFLDLKKTAIGQKYEDIGFMCDVDEELVQRLKLREQLKPIVSGEYLRGRSEQSNRAEQQSEKLVPEAAPAPMSPTPEGEVEEEEEVTFARPAIVAPPPPPPAAASAAATATAAAEAAAAAAAEAAAAAAAAATHPQAPAPTEDSAIQDLLDDIRGSFERQFDNEFEELSAEDIQAAADAVGGPAVGGGVEQGDSAAEEMPFVIDASFPAMALDAFPPVASANEAEAGTVAGQQQQISAQPSAADHQDPRQQQPFMFHQQQPPEEMPCIVNSWTVDDDSNSGGGNTNSGGPGGSFLNAGSISQEVFDNFFSSQQMGVGGPDGSIGMGQPLQQPQQQVYPQQHQYNDQQMHYQQPQEHEQQQYPNYYNHQGM